MKGFLVDVSNGTAEEVDFQSNLDCHHKMLGCGTIDIVSRIIDGTQFDIVCDDEALLKADPVPGAVYSDGSPALFGSLLFCGHDDEGGLASLTETQTAILEKHTATVLYGDRFLKMVTGIEFL